LPVIEIAPRLSMGSPTPSDQRPAARPASEPELATSLDSPSARSVDASAAAPSDPRRIDRLRHLKPVLIAGAAGVAIAIAVIIFIARATNDSGAIASRAEPMQRLPVPQTPAPTVQAPAPAPTPAPAPVAKPTEPPPAPPISPKANMIDVEIRVTPGTATISIDGKDVEGNPYSTQFPADDIMHRIRAAAPGYVTKSSSVAFNANVTLDFSLERITPVAAPSPPPRTQVRPSPRVPQRTTPPAPRQADPPRTVENKQPDPPRAETAAPRPADPPQAAPASAPGMVDPNGGKAPTRTIERKDPYSSGGGQ